MKADELLRFSALRETSFSQENQISSQLITAQPDETKSNLAARFNKEVLWIPVSFIIVWTVFILMSSDIWAIARHGLLSIFHLQRVPCKNCRFFQNNPYLQCAVHPSTALTSEAVHCSDYWPQKRKY